MKLTIPAQQPHIDPSVETQPRALREWADELPYLTPVLAAQQVRALLQKLNRQPLPPTRRLEILDILAAPYWRLFEALLAIPETRARGNLETGASLRALQHYCQDLAFGYKISVHGTQGKSTLFGRNKPQQAAILLTIRYLGQQLAHRYAEYQRLPSSLWSEIDQLYRYARGRGYHQQPHTGPRGESTSIEQSYLEILLLKVSDPFRLPTGRLWETRRFLQRHTPQVQLHPWAENEEQEGLYYLPATNPEADGYRHGLCLNLQELMAVTKQELQALNNGKKPRDLGFSEHLPTAEAIQILERLLRGWHQDVARKAERIPLQADAEIAIGLESAFYFLNRGLAFDRHAYLAPETADTEHIDPGSQAQQWDPAKQTSFPHLSCHTLNRSAGGIAVRCNWAPEEAPKVGQLIAIRSQPRGSEEPGVWFVASTRWLRVDTNTFFELGAQYLARDAIPVAVRTYYNQQGGKEFHAALRTDLQQGDRHWHILITPPGLYAEGHYLELVRGGHRERVRCVKMLETGSGFQRFQYEPAPH